MWNNFFKELIVLEICFTFLLKMYRLSVPETVWTEKAQIQIKIGYWIQIQLEQISGPGSKYKVFKSTFHNPALTPVNFVMFSSE